MKLKNEIFSSKSFESFIEKINMYDGFPIKQSYKIYEMMQEVIKRRDIYQSQEVKIIKKYGNEQEDGSIIIDKEHLEAFSADIEELREIEFDLNAEKLHLNLDDIDLKISPDEISSALTFFEIS